MAGLECQSEKVTRECSDGGWGVGGGGREGAGDKGRNGEAQDGFKEESLKKMKRLEKESEKEEMGDTREIRRRDRQGSTWGKERIRIKEVQQRIKK